MALRVSVLIPHYNDLANLELCVVALTAQTLAREAYEIIVADNNSSVGIDAVCAAVGAHARVVAAPEQGAGPARNVAAALAQAPALAFIDSDCLPARDWLERGLAALARAEIVGGAVAATALDPANPTPSEAFELVFAFQMKRYVEREGFAGSGNLFVRRSAFDAVGGFRNGIAEDTEWGRRALTRGYRTVFDGSVCATHPARRNWRELRRKWQRLTFERYVLTRERAYGRLIWIGTSWLILLSPFVHVARVLRSPRLGSARARLGAIAILFRLRAYRFTQAYRVLLSDLGTSRRQSSVA
jgi:glycosyltransferase involved in cell wall biosynthesis